MAVFQENVVYIHRRGAGVGRWPTGGCPPSGHRGARRGGGGGGEEQEEDLAVESLCSIFSVLRRPMSLNASVCVCARVRVRAVCCSFICSPRRVDQVVSH